MTCPQCGSNRLKRGGENLWCDNCGFFPIPFEQEEKEMSTKPKEVRPLKDLFDGTETERRIVLTPIQETKFPPSRAIAAAYWISYFTLHWLLILDVIEFTTARGFCTTYFLVTAVLATMMIAADEAAGERKK